MRCGGIFDLAAAKKRLAALEEQASSADLWSDPERAQQVMKERTDLRERVRALEEPLARLDDVHALIELAEEAGPEEVADEVESELRAIGKAVDQLEFQRMLGGPADREGAIVHINAGAGGLESQDWAQMLLRMYLRWCDRRGYKTRIVDMLEGDEAGIKSATFEVEGPYAYGYLKAEAGVHRLVRISPFDAAKRRHTSFASVFVYPAVSDDIEIEIRESDLRIDTFRASGAGGQHVNKTDSAVRITHIPTGIVVSCQNERSQHKNRSTALKILKSRLYALELEKREKELASVHAQKKEIGFGSQIRSYVLHPYRMVKDHRTGYEVGNADAVLDGDLDGFIRAYLIQAGSDAPGAGASASGSSPSASA